MKIFLAKLIHNQSLNDIAGILRGVYRVAASNTQPHPTYSPPTTSQHSTSTTKHTSSTQNNTSHPISPIQKPITQNINTSNKNTLLQSHQFKSQSSRIEQISLKQNKLQQSQSTLKKQKQQISEGTLSKIQTNLQAKSMPYTTFSRVFQIGILGTKIAKNTITNVILNKLGISKEENIVNEANGRLIAKTLSKLRGVPLKLGQFLSIQQQKLIPIQFSKAFQQVRNQANIIPDKQLFQMLKDQLGPKFMDHFQIFQKKPIAAASIGQVHFCKLKDGRKLALKIQYPGVLQCLDSDLKILKNMFSLIKLPKSLYINRILKNIRQQLQQEIEYILEARKQKQYKQNFKNWNQIHVPYIVDQLTTRKVLAMEFVEGIELQNISSEGRRNWLGWMMMKVTLHQIFVYRLMQSDPNPGNFSYNITEKKINLIDFGATISYNKKFIDYYFQVVCASLERDQQRILRALIKLQLLTGQQNKQSKRSHINSILVLADPFRNQFYDFGDSQITKNIYREIPKILENRLKPPPFQIYSLHRKFSGSFLFNINLKAKGNYKQLFDQIKVNYIIQNQI